MAAITLYQYSGEPERVDKTSMLTSAVQISPQIYRDSIDLHAPVFDVEQNLSAAINFAKIEQDGRTWYYFCRIENIRRGLSRVYCDIDVLQTYCNSEAFNAIPIVPQRSASNNAYNAWIADTMQPVEVAKYCEIMNPTGYDPALPDACLDYAELSLVAGIIGTEDKIGTTVQQVQTN